ncbi:hypothetical protein PINS_up020361 [Pythium insidiosum]|nr:hypothetical protein PINS_up020361 [Pythium insidiosum]
MRVYAALLASAAAVVAADDAAPRINGWYPCGYSSDVSEGDPNAKIFQCAEVEVPLCHDGVCESDKTIDLFVKRLPASKEPDSGETKALWMLQGGPGASSVALEGHMVNIFAQLNGTASLYTMDHRGTGRSFFLDCDAAQAFSSGSPAGVTVDFPEVPNCVKDILFQIDDQPAAFSVTSAAKDIEFLTKHLNTEDGKETFVYGCSYGTYFTERIMHLAPPNIKGYIVDGVVPEDNPSFTTTNADRVPPAKFLAQYCEEQESCAAMYKDLTAKHGDIYSSWLAIYKDLDAAPKGENKCSDLGRDANDPKWLPSDTFKTKLTSYGGDLTNRLLLPVLMYRLHRCSEADAQYFAELFQLSAAAAPSASASGSDDDDAAAEPRIRPRRRSTSSGKAAHSSAPSSRPPRCGSSRHRRGRRSSRSFARRRSRRRWWATTAWCAY